MKLVIQIPDEVVKNNNYVNYFGVFSKKLMETIKNSVPLPKGCGRLGDLDALEKEVVDGIKAGNYEEGYETFAHINTVDDCVECIKYADTIISADEEQE